MQKTARQRKTNSDAITASRLLTPPPETVRVFNTWQQRSEIITCADYITMQQAGYKYYFSG